MSRTDKTKPWPVRVAEHRPLAVHDHRNGECNLPDSPLASLGYCGTWRKFDCRWSDNTMIYSSCCGGCGCRTCAGYYWRRTDRRRSRHQARLEARRLVVELDWDGWSPSRSTSSW